MKLFCVLISAAQVNVKTCRTEQVNLSSYQFFLNKKISRRGKKRPTNLVLARIKTGILIHYWWEYELEQSLWKTIQWFLIKLNVYLPCDLGVAL